MPTSSPHDVAQGLAHILIAEAEAHGLRGRAQVCTMQYVTVIETQTKQDNKEHQREPVACASGHRLYHARWRV